MPYLPILFRIQELDSKIDSLKKAQEQANLDPNISALQSFQQQAGASLANIEKERNRIYNSQRRLELDLKVCLEHRQNEEGKLYNGSVASSRSLEQLQQKVAEYQRQQTEIEDDILGLLEEDEKLVAKEVDLQRRLATCKLEITSFQQQLQQKLAEIALEESELQFELNELQSKVPTEWLERYHKIAKAHFGIGIAKIKNGSCGACHVGLSDLLMRKAKQGEDTLIFCEDCGRILYYG